MTNLRALRDKAARDDVVVRLSNPCEKCGARFELRYNKRSGEAVQFWPNPCGPDSDCFKRLMPPSDFVMR